MYGVLMCPTAIALPSGLNATPFPVPAGRVDGSPYLSPKPDWFQGYAEINGVV
jgi:hypothetical protein